MSLPRKRIAPVAAVDAADAVENAGLAGAVRADQREQFAGLGRKRHAVQHGQAAKTQAQMLDRKLSHTTSAIRRYCLTSR